MAKTDEPIGVDTLWGLPVLIEDSPLTRLLGYYFIADPLKDEEREEDENA